MAKSKTASPPIGSNSNVADADGRKLKGFVSEIVRVERQIAELKGEVGTYYESAKDSNFDTSAMRRVVKLALMDSEKRAKHEAKEATFDAYKLSCGDMFGTPLEIASRPREFSSEDMPRTAMGS